MKRVLFLIDTLGAGGAERALVDTVNNLPKDKYDITVVTIFDSGIHRKNLNSYIKYKSLLKECKVNRWLFWRTLKLMPKSAMYKLLIKEEYDIEVAYIEGLSTILISGSMNQKSKKIAWVHTDLYNNYYNSMLFKSLKENIEVYKKFNSIVCVSKEAERGFIKRFGAFSNVKTIHNPIDLECIVKRAEEIVTDLSRGTKFRFIAVGRLIEQKGFLRLLEAHKKLIKNGIENEVVIIGDGVEKSNLKSYIRENEIEGTVKLLGFKENPYKYFSLCDCFICSSFVEGYPLVVAEAMCLDIPVISTDRTGSNEMLGYGKYGLLTENCTEGIYDAMKKVILDRELLDDLKLKSRDGKNIFNLKNVIYEIGGVLNE